MPAFVHGQAEPDDKTAKPEAATSNAPVLDSQEPSTGAAPLVPAPLPQQPAVSTQTISPGPPLEVAPAKPPPPTLDSIKGGALIRYGLAAGLAISIHIPADDTGQRQLGTGATPYLAVLPLYWLIRGEESRAYCAARYVKPSDEAQRYADDYAKYRARSRDPKLVEQERGWEVGSPARDCWRGWFGAYVGIPLAKFTANSGDPAGDVDKTKAREFNPIVSTGLILTPYAAIALLPGVSFWNVVAENGHNKVVMTWSLSLGANIDVIGAMVGK